MAYMDSDLKKALIAGAKGILPKGWAISGKVRNYQKLDITLKVPREVYESIYNYTKSHECKDNADYSKDFCFSFDLGEIRVPNSINRDDGRFNRPYQKEIAAIIAAIESRNFNESDSMRDFKNVGYYTGYKIISK